MWVQAACQQCLPELVHGAGAGAQFDSCARCRIEEPGMSPKEIWCNESQERYVLAIAAPESLPLFKAMCRPRALPLCWWSGDRHPMKQLVLEDTLFDQQAVDMPMDVLLGKPPSMHARRTIAQRPTEAPFDLAGLELDDAAYRVLRHLPDRGRQSAS